MKIIVARAAAKTLKQPLRYQAARITAAIGNLPAGDVKRLQRRPDYRLRLGSWRVIFAMDGRHSRTLLERLPAELRNHPGIDMLKESKARIVPLDLFKKKSLEALEDELDAEAAAAAADAFARDKAARGRAGAEPAIPFEVLQAEAAGAHPIAAWRKYRGMTQARLAEEIGIDRGYLAQIERGGRAGTPETLAKIARALGCLVGDLLG